MRSNARRIGPGIVLAVDAAVDHLGVHAGAADVLADLVQDQDVEVHRESCAIQDFTSARFSSSRCSMTSTGTASSLRGVVVGVFENRQAAQNLARLQHLPPDAADDVLQAQLVGVGVVALRAGELAESDGHHLEQAAFDLAREIGVPLDAAHQHHAIGFVGRCGP